MRMSMTVRMRVTMAIVTVRMAGVAGVVGVAMVAMVVVVVVVDRVVRVVMVFVRHATIIPMTTFSAAILLFFVMDPIGNIPLFLAAIRPVRPDRRLWVIGRELLIAYGLLVGFLYAGRPLLSALGISGPALTMAGGIVLFLIALKMVFPERHGSLGEPVEGEPFVVPLAIPYIAGPSALATVLLMTSRSPERHADWLMAVSLAWLASAVILLLGTQLSRFLGDKGIVAIERLMGMVLVASAVQMFLDGAAVVMRT
jgi:MarC family membrane protein